MLGRYNVAITVGGYAALGIARLIYFTLDKDPIPGFFKGMPTPAAAMLAVAQDDLKRRLEALGENE